jgi:DNA-binding transcriptional regulator YhcF (GntR family)
MVVIAVQSRKLGGERTPSVRSMNEVIQSGTNTRSLLYLYLVEAARVPIIERAVFSKSEAVRPIKPADRFAWNYHCSVSVFLGNLNTINRALKQVHFFFLASLTELEINCIVKLA